MRIFSPAKVNLLLAVTGRREDGFHDLVSLVSPVSFGDFLSVSIDGAPKTITLTCTDPEVPTGEDNLVVRAARAFLAKTRSKVGLRIHLEKHIPMEAGLGGGSGNAAGALLHLNALMGKPLSFEDLVGLAGETGSDCPLFLHGEPLIMRGRGELLERLPENVLFGLQGRKLALFKPGIGISTTWAYQRLAAEPARYACAKNIEKRLEEWKCGRVALEDLLMNSFEAPVFDKFMVFPALFQWIQAETGLRCLLSGSGSCCFALVKTQAQRDKLEELVKSAWGEEAFFKVCQLGVSGMNNRWDG